MCQHRRQIRLALPPPAVAAGAPPPSTPPQLLPSMPQAPIVHNLLAAGTGAGHHSVGRHPQCLKLVVPPALVSGSGTRPVPTSPPGAVAAVPIAHTPPHKHQRPSLVAQWLRALHDREARLVCGLKLHHAITVGLLCFIAVLSWNANEQRSMDVMVRQAHAYNATVAACPQQAACPACPAAIPAPAVECPASPECPPSTPTPTSTDICFKQEDFNSMFTARVVKPDGFLSGYLNAVKPSPHYPTFSELAVTGQRAVCTARRLTPRQYDAPAGRGLPARASGAVRVTSSWHRWGQKAAVNAAKQGSS